MRLGPGLRLRAVARGAVWVHCQSGYRAWITASILAATGHEAVLVNDDFDKAGQVGLDLTRPVTAFVAAQARP